MTTTTTYSGLDANGNATTDRLWYQASGTGGGLLQRQRHHDASGRPADSKVRRTSNLTGHLTVTSTNVAAAN